MQRVLLAIVLALALAACSAVPTFVLPALVDTTEGVAGIHIGGTADGPALLRTSATYDTFAAEAYDDAYGYANGGARPTWIPADAAAYLALSCAYGTSEALVFDTGLTDAWDGTDLRVGGSFGGDVGFDDGTLYGFADGTLVLTCAATAAPEGLEVTRHMIVPGGGADGRFAVEVLTFAATTEGGFDLTLVDIGLDDGADDDAIKSWQSYGTIEAFAWATKDDEDLDDPAIGLVPLVSTHFTVDADATGGDEYWITGIGILAQGQTAAAAFLTGIRGGFEPGDAVGKDAAMQALGAELAEFDGGALCATPRPTFFTWAALLDADDDLLDDLCAGWAALD